LLEVADHDFRVDEVFCATEGDEAYFDHNFWAAKIHRL
jgi:hypothetical protein